MAHVYVYISKFQYTRGGACIQGVEPMYIQRVAPIYSGWRLYIEGVALIYKEWRLYTRGGAYEQGGAPFYKGWRLYT